MKRLNEFERATVQSEFKTELSPPLKVHLRELSLKKKFNLDKIVQVESFRVVHML